MNDSESLPRYVEVDAARLLLILNTFSIAIDNKAKQLKSYPSRSVIRYFTPEYKLQKLDFLIRYPTYLAYELVELHRLRIEPISPRMEIMKIVRSILAEKEPDLRTAIYRKYLRGAYEQLDQVESWWYSRELVYSAFERRGGSDSPSRPQKYYFLTKKGEAVAKDLVENIEHAQWYNERIALAHKYFGHLSAGFIKKLQYSHEPYRKAQINEEIPDLPLEELTSSFEDVFEEPLGVEI